MLTIIIIITVINLSIGLLDVAPDHWFVPTDQISFSFKDILILIVFAGTGRAVQREVELNIGLD